jgi:hypothetical protein
LLEARKDQYFTDGFLIKYFNIFPVNFDRENLFPEQKAFLVYLLGIIPSLETWSLNVEYLLKKREIENLTTRDIVLGESEIDLIKMRNGDIEKIKRERVPQEKKKRLEELNKEYGIEIEKEEVNYSIPAMQNVKDPRARIYDLLMGKGLVKKDGK